MTNISSQSPNMLKYWKRRDSMKSQKLVKMAAAGVFMLSLGAGAGVQAEGVTKAASSVQPLITAANAQVNIAEVQKMLREVAVQKGIPAEILKAIAYVETGMMQFDGNGSPIISNDGGIGIMQLTLTPSEISQYNVDVERLKKDTRYNIEQGADQLLRKWNNSNLPQVNKHEKEKIEDWYFAIMSYNGLSKRNDPNHAGGNAYQEKVFQTIRENSLVELGETPKLDIRYPDASRPELMTFPAGVDYTWPTSTKTTQNYKNKAVAYTYNTARSTSNLRDSITDATPEAILHYTPVEITGGPYESGSSIYNQYVFYKVKGTGFEGYMASSNLVTSNELTYFKDVYNKGVSRAVTFLQTRDTINGYTDGTYRPEVKLLRYHAAKLIVQALDLKLPAGYKMKADDMKPGSPGYEYMLIAEANGIMGAGGKLKPYDPLTRSEMASILVRSFGDTYNQPPAGYHFAGIAPFHPNRTDITKLAYNKITNSVPYNGNNTVDRGQYALFLERSVKMKEAKN